VIGYVVNTRDLLNYVKLYIFKFILLDVDESIVICMIKKTENKTNYLKYTQATIWTKHLTDK
jgi:hypothetical protein